MPELLLILLLCTAELNWISLICCTNVDSPPLQAVSTKFNDELSRFVVEKLRIKLQQYFPATRIENGC